MAYAQYTQIGGKTVFVQQHNQGDVVYVKSIDLQGQQIQGTAECNQGDWEILFPDGAIEIWSNLDFTNQYA